MKILDYLGCIVVAAMTLGTAAMAGDGKLPKGTRGFSGLVRGVVAERGEGDAVWVRVGRLKQVWDNNRADEPEAIVGKTIRVTPSWIQGDGGQWHPNERHVAFIRSLKAGQELDIEIQNVEGDAFAILELADSQTDREPVREDRRRDHEARERGERGERMARAEREQREEPGPGRRQEVLIQVLREEMSRLYRENAELRARIEELERNRR